MKAFKILLSVAVISLFLYGNSFAEERSGKVASVNLSQLFDEYQKTKDYDKKLEAEQKVKEADRTKKIDEIKDLQQKLAVANDKDKDRLQAQVDEKMKVLQEFDRQAQTDLRKQRDDLLKEILKEIEKVISDYAQKEGYAVVFNDRVLLYSNPQLDITEPLIKILNEKYTPKKK
jgi:outer membrane protein